MWVRTFGREAAASGAGCVRFLDKHTPPDVPHKERLGARCQQVVATARVAATATAVCAARYMLHAAAAAFGTAATADELHVRPRCCRSRQLQLGMAPTLALSRPQSLRKGEATGTGGRSRPGGGAGAKPRKNV
eukprot:365073-Chlamydomonas_euryale.AAC.5